MSHGGGVDRLGGMDDHRTFVIGGGLAGLTAAATLARAGRPVTVLEAAEHIGGRARTRQRDGFTLNLGPHALYRVGGGAATLRGLGVRPHGRMPRIHRAGMLMGDQVRPAFGHLRTDTTQRSAALRLLTGLGAEAAAELNGISAAAWLESALDDPAARALVASVLRTATYTGNHTLLDAGAAARQLRAAARGVLYLHGGWSSLVDGLADVIRGAGGRIHTRAAVAAVEHDRAVRSVRLADGTSLGADAAVVAVNDPRRAAGLLDGPGAMTVGDAAATTVPVRVAHLDVALRPLPAPRYPNVLGLDEPVYLTVQSDVARMAPPGGAAIHVARYLSPGEEAGDHRASLEHTLDVAQPGWRDHIVDARYVPRSMVAGDHARPATRGPADRPPVGVADVDGLALAGDWIGPTGTLADASIVSGQAAAWVLMAGRVPAPA
jgi:phytoene dehydrogenase-like protein